MKYIQDKSKLINARQLEKNNKISDLEWLRLRIVIVLNTIFFVLLIPSFCVELQLGNFVFVGFGLICLFSLVISTLLIIKGHQQIPIFITSVIVPSNAFYIAFLDVIPYQALFSSLCLLLVLNIWLINSYRVRIFYSLIYFALLFLFFYVHNPLMGTIQTLSIILGYIIVFHFLTLFVEQQDKHLTKSLANQKFLNITLKDKNSQLQTFSHIMSHDLKGPLTTINSFSKLIKQKIKFEDEGHKQYFAFIENSTKEMRTLLDELLLFQKIESEVLDFATINLNEVIDAISSIYQYDLSENRIKFKLTPLPEVQGNFILLKALFGNLISNSIKYQPKEKTNHIPQIEIWSSTDQADYIEIYLSDNGIGIDEGYIKNLFQPFKRFHSSQEYEGTGLGLSICKSIMEKHLGSIELYESLENGTTFKLKFRKKTTTNIR